MPSVNEKIVTLLVNAAGEVISGTSISEPWNEGWHIEAYRQSSKAAVMSSNAAFTLSPKGMQKFEEAVVMLLRIPAVRERWGTEHIWAVVVHLLVFASRSDDLQAAITKAMPRLLKPRNCLVTLPIANITWSGAPCTIGKTAIIGTAGPAFDAAVTQLAKANKASVHGFIPSSKQDECRSNTPYFATIVPGQRGIAFDQAVGNLTTILSVALMLTVNKDQPRLHGGSWNRPDARGLGIDRAAIISALDQSEGIHEVFCQPLMIDELGSTHQRHWYSADPLPLNLLLGNDQILEATSDCLTARTVIDRRLRIAGRWFAESFWSSSPDDKVLALGVSLDALIGSKSGLPGRAMRERFAFLEPQPSERGALSKRYDQVYAVRSTVAHGGETKAVKEQGFVREFESMVTWAAWRLIDTVKSFSILHDNDLEQMFDELRWGTRTWPSDARSSEYWRPAPTPEAVPGACGQTLDKGIPAAP